MSTRLRRWTCSQCAPAQLPCRLTAEVDGRRWELEWVKRDSLTPALAAAAAARRDRARRPLATTTPPTTDHFIFTPPVRSATPASASHLHRRRRRRKCFITDKCACSLAAWRHYRKYAAGSADTELAVDQYTYTTLRQLLLLLLFICVFSFANFGQKSLTT